MVSESLKCSLRSELNSISTSVPVNSTRSNKNVEVESKIVTRQSEPEGGKWSQVVVRKRAPVAAASNVSQRQTISPTIIGKCASASLKAKPLEQRERKIRTESIYVGNLQEITASTMQTYIEDAYYSAFHERVTITKVFPLIKRPDTIASEPLQDNYSPTATSFRVIFDHAHSNNMMNALIWPSDVIVRRWVYKNTAITNNTAHKSEHSTSSTNDNNNEQSTYSPLSNAMVNVEADTTDESSKQADTAFRINGQPK
jgi:hypothetical protein